MKRILAWLVIVIILASCGSAPKHKAPQDRFSHKQRLTIATTARSYLGLPYRYGGRNKNGFDCSGLVNRVYTEALGMKLPRTTGKLFELSYQINSRQAGTGDLAFFRIKGARIDHVGIMINRYEFIHASTSRGVIVSNFKSDYYRKHFAGIRRLR
ncbi:MAG: hypothetical protein GY839_00400 [candidate division Zixibacteria bacterium]|nr:hypothetical protein [candidate division Zixibacteria bacterium]